MIKQHPCNGSGQVKIFSDIVLVPADELHMRLPRDVVAEFEIGKRVAAPAPVAAPKAASSGLPSGLSSMAGPKSRARKEPKDPDAKAHDPAKSASSKFLFCGVVRAFSIFSVQQSVFVIVTFCSNLFSGQMLTRRTISAI